ncbi:MAG: hypothetical protein MZV63_46885 [Marinilabiliales bacterium]|nr:hypothetical protein [Marinilabiliales bacterium]
MLGFGFDGKGWDGDSAENGKTSRAGIRRLSTSSWKRPEARTPPAG